MQRHTLKARPIEPTPRKDETPVPIEGNRRCRVRGCATYLNRYHDSDRCYAHESKRYRMVESVVDLRELMEED